uniref:Uncharacterized protein n=1 Tax=Arundo donax TaxID=35708 RepID=A0A0A9GGF6_ARUDO
MLYVVRLGLTDPSTSIMSKTRCDSSGLPTMPYPLISVLKVLVVGWQPECFIFQKVFIASPIRFASTNTLIKAL